MLRQPRNLAPLLGPGYTPGRREEAIATFVAGLVEAGVLTKSDADRALEAIRRSSQDIDTVLMELGLIGEDELLQEVARFFGIEVIAGSEMPEALDLCGLDLNFCRRHSVVPLGISDDGLALAVADPFDDQLLKAIAYFVDRPVESKLMRRRDIEQALASLEGDPTEVRAIGGDGLLVSNDEIDRLKEAASEAPVVRYVNRILSSAVQMGASDVHIETRPQNAIVRYRVDGDLRDAEVLAHGMQANVATRLKILAKLNIAERRLPQDGRLKIMVAGREIDVRLSFVPTQHGESAVLRLLDKGRMTFSFDALGVDGHARTTLETVLQHPNGIALVTGPTGSGKTTTLYAALRLLNSASRKVFTVEDPIEYQLVGINQMQVKREIGLDFVHALRAILRQDPDVVMLGEIRDVETARTAIQASLTGHLVLSTLHTNSAAASLTRLIDMGIEEFLIASSLTGIVAQRLVRRLCQACSQPAQFDQALVQRLVAELARTGSDVDPGGLRQPVGCDQCQRTGYSGRTVIAEGLLVTDEIRGHILRRGSEADVERSACAAGMETLLQSGLRKAFAGITTVDEVSRVARFKQ